MAGGKGERFWPRSRERLPKQFLALVDPGKTMIQATVDRIRPLVEIQNIYIATNQAYRELVCEQLPDLPEENILLEPCARNTAPCIGWGAVEIRRKYGDAMMLVLPSDHLIRQPGLFHRAMKKAMRVAERGEALVTLGVAPDAPNTEYGYIQYDADEGDENNGFHVKRFVEKPDVNIAKSYLASGEYLWNSGMFIWKASAILKAMEKELPEHYALLKKIETVSGTSLYEQTLRDVFETMKPISIDYGIMEKVDNAYVIPVSFGWDDVGSWLAVGRLSSSDESGNVIRGHVVRVDSERCIVQGENRIIALVGMEDAIVVDTKDALLVCAKESVGKIKKAMELLRAENRTEVL